MTQADVGGAKSHSPERSEETLLLDYLRDRDATCPVCQYNVRGLTIARCPECGQNLRLSVGAFEPYLTAWVVLVVATVAATGIAMLLDIMLAYNVWWRNRPAPYYNIFQWLGYFSFNISVLPAFFAVFFRRRVLRWQTNTQWFWAIVFVTLLVAQFFFFITIR